jgi:hypothetical protein
MTPEGQGRKARQNQRNVPTKFLAPFLLLVEYAAGQSTVEQAVWIRPSRKNGQRPHKLRSGKLRRHHAPLGESCDIGEYR